MITKLAGTNRVSIASQSSVVALAFSDAPTLEDVAAVEAAYDKMAKQHASFCVLLIINGENPKVDGPVRERLGQVLKRLDAHLKATATVIQMPGLKGTVVRSFVTGLNMLTRTKSQGKVFESVRDAAAWLGPLSGQPQAVNELAEASVQHARAA